VPSLCSAIALQCHRFSVPLLCSAIVLQCFLSQLILENFARVTDQWNVQFMNKGSIKVNLSQRIIFQLDLIRQLNNDQDVHGVMVQLPLPAHMNETVVCNAVAAAKDVDGFSDSNLGRLVQGGVGHRGVFVPCTALAVASIIRVNIIKDLLTRQDLVSNLFIYI
jgi:5,10-methylene-tetrahydrofolate dehydrogenase/methenyl tetrahydrofolate cyclohydrolase